MTFSSIMTFICVGYVLAYGGMVIYDLFLAKEPIELSQKVEEEEIDISDEAKTFNPVFIDKDGRFHWEQDYGQNEGGVLVQVEDVFEKQPDERPEEKSEPTESPSDDKTLQQSGEDAEFNHETVSASEKEASAREQAWIYAQTGGAVDTEANSDVEADSDSDDEIETDANTVVCMETCPRMSRMITRFTPD